MVKEKLLLKQMVITPPEQSIDDEYRLMMDAEEGRLLMEQDCIEHEPERLPAWG